MRIDRLCGRSWTRTDGPELDLGMPADVYSCGAESPAVPAWDTSQLPSSGANRCLDGKSCCRLNDNVKKISGVGKSEVLQQKK